MSYRRRASPLHAARAAAAVCWCTALALATILAGNPLVLASLGAGVLLAGALAGVWRALRQALLLAAVMALTICVINALVTRQGLTVIWRFGDLPLLGQINVTLEATVYGALLGMRAATLLLLGALYSACVDPDAVLALFGRFSFRSALSASIATRMLPLLARDSRRLADAQRTRPGAAVGRVALLRASTAGVLDRALDVAATLEVRGYALAGARRRSGAGPLSRHDLAFSASAVVVLTCSGLGAVLGWAPFSAYPQLRMAAGLRVAALSLLLVLAALAPFADRRGVSP